MCIRDSHRGMDARGQAERIRQFWDGYAADYDAEPDHGLRGPGMHRAWRDLLARALPPAPARVADLGCGTGSLTEVVASLGHRVWACDSSAAMVALAGAKVARFADRVTVRQADACLLYTSRCVSETAVMAPLR